jgi:aryl-alcohol dehydrogenase-like predicted oxidoreductase
MASGMLTGAFDRTRIDRFDPADWRRQSPVFQDPQLSNNLAFVERLRAIAQRLGTSVPALAVAWTLAQPGVTAAIVGGRFPRHVDGWLPASELELGEDVLRELDEAVVASDAGSDEPPAPPPHMLRQATS